MMRRSDMEEKDDTTLGNEMSLEEFMQYLKSIEERSDREDELLEFYNKAWEIRLGTKLVRVLFDAVSFNAIYDALSKIKSEE